MRISDTENRNQLSILKSLENLLKDLHERVLKECLDLKEEKENLEQRLKVSEELNKGLLNKISTCQKQIEECDKKIVEARVTAANIAEKTIAGAHQDKAIYDLLQNVTQTRFDEALSDEVLRGMIVHSSDIEPFSFNLAETSEKDIRVQLWDKLKAGSTFFGKST